MKKVMTTDLRTIRTRKAIHTAFQQMATEIGIEHITVKELSERAGINRKTFYSHYDSIEALEQELLQGLVQEILEIANKEQPHEFRDTLADIYRYLSTLPLWYRNLMCATDSPLAQGVFLNLIDGYIAAYREKNDPVQIRQYMKLRYIASASIELFKAWHESDGAIPVEEFVHTATGLICFGEKYI